MKKKTSCTKITQFVFSLFLAHFLMACSVEQEQKNSPTPPSRARAKVRLRTEDLTVSISLKNKTSDFTTTGFNIFRGETLVLTPEVFFWEKRARDSETNIASHTWGGCDSTKTRCWNKNAETYSMEFSPPAQIEVLSPLVNMTDLLEKILLEFELRSGNKVVCSAQHLLAEKNTVNAYLQIENNSDCLIYQNEEDEIYNVSLLNQTNFGELKYLTGNFIRSDDGNSGGYTEVSYNPDTLLNLKVSVLKSTELK